MSIYQGISHFTASMNTTAEMSEEVTKSASKSRYSENSTSVMDDPLEIDRNGSTENLIGKVIF